MTRSRRDEQGLAMMITVATVAIAATLAAVILTQGSSTERHSARGANWNQALQTADAGVEEAIAKLQAGNGALPAPFTTVHSDGEYSVTVTYLGRNRYQIDSTGTVGQAAGLRTERTVRVVMGPPKTFEFALLSFTDIDTKNNNHVVGDVWANGNVTIDNNDVVDGDVTAATGFVTMRNGSRVNGDVVSGGYNGSGVAMALETVTGNVTAASTSPGCIDDAGHAKYKIQGGSVGGNATTWGTVTSSVSGTSQVHVCSAAPATKSIPTFTFNAANYNPAPLTFASPSAFNAYAQANKSSFSGTFYVAGGGQNDPVDITGLVLVGDTTIIATQAPITASSADVTSGNDNDKVFVLASYYQPPAGVACSDNGGNPGDCAVGIKNNFSVANNTATLIYAPNGPVTFKNNADFSGAVYANNIVMKNNQTTTYDARVDQVVGFGPVTLERESWVELSD
jgi:hypothetical protein